MSTIFIHSNFILMATVMLSMLVLATTCNAMLNYYVPSLASHELDLRIRSWWIMCGIFMIVLLLGTGFTIFFMGFVSFLALKEYLSIIPTRLIDRRVLFWAYVSIIIQYYLIFIEWYGMFLIFIPIYCFLFLPFRMEIAGETKGFLKAIGTTQWGLMLFVFSLSHMTYLLVLPSSTISFRGTSLLFYFVFLAQFNDVSQYIWGKCLGRYKIMPRISPKKTLAGFLGGVFNTTIASVILFQYLTLLNIYQAIFSGMIISISGFIGDITVSAIKRDLGIKDSSQAIPGHGGILDRVDSLTYAAPLFFHFVNYLNIY